MATKSLDRLSGRRVGRPSKRAPAVVEKLLAALQHSYTISEACVYAGINRTTYYNWVEEDESFLNRVEAAKMHPNMMAREAIMDAIAKKKWMAAAWWLERKMPEEFASRQKVDLEAKIVTVNLSPEQWEGLIGATGAADSIDTSKAAGALPEGGREGQAS